MSTLSNPTGNQVTTTHNFAPTTGFASDTQDLVKLAAGFNYTYGTGPLQFDCPWSHRNDALTGTDTFTLSSLVIAGGATVVSVRALEFTVLNIGTVAITLAPNTTNGWTNGIPTGGKIIQPGGYYSWADGDVGAVITAGSNDQIKLTVSSGTGKYRIVFKGRTV